MYYPGDRNSLNAKIQAPFVLAEIRALRASIFKSSPEIQRALAIADRVEQSYDLTRPDLFIPALDTYCAILEPFAMTVLTGTDVASHAHVDANYRLGAMGAGGDRPHFAQHLVSVSASVEASDRWSPYAETYWLSSEEPDGDPIAAIDVGAIYTVHSRLAIDGGIQFGISRAAPGFAVFAGLSFAVGGSSDARPIAPTSAFRPVRDRD